MKTLDQDEARALRNRVFGKEISDGEWLLCRERWLAPEVLFWLKRHDFPVGTSCPHPAANVGGTA